jgi:hypothetical protein
MKLDIQKISPIGLRTAILKEGGLEIPLPNRALSSVDAYAGEKIENAFGIKVRFPHPVYSIPKYYKPDSFIKILHDSEVSHAQQLTVGRASRKGSIRWTSYNPAFDRGVWLKFDYDANSKFMEIAFQSDIDGIPIHDQLGSTLTQTADTVRKSLKEIDKAGGVKQPVFRIRADTDDRWFQRKIETAISLIKEYGWEIPIVDVVKASIEGNIKNYAYVRNDLRKKKILLISSDTEKTWRPNKKTSMPHIMVLFGFDLVILRSRLYFPSVAKMYDRQTWANLLQPELNQLYGNQMVNDCVIDQNRTHDDVFDVYSGVEGCLNSAIKSHDAISSFGQFIQMQQATEQSKLWNLLHRKAYMFEPILRLLRWDLNQKPLISF